MPPRTSPCAARSTKVVREFDLAPRKVLSRCRKGEASSEALSFRRTVRGFSGRVAASLARPLAAPEDLSATNRSMLHSQVSVERGLRGELVMECSQRPK